MLLQGLLLNQFGIDATFVNKFAMRTALSYLAVFQYENMVRILNSRETMGHCNCRAILGSRIQCSLYDLF